jgi:hypothetical protein
MGPIAGLVNVEKRKFLTLPGLEHRLLGLPARSRSLYRLSYPGSVLGGSTVGNFTFNVFTITFVL